MWNRLLIFLHLRRDWAKEIDLAPPAFDSVPHVYDPFINGKMLTYCAECGGGPKHSIHTKHVTPASSPARPPMVEHRNPTEWQL
jgi:hypothetical protein